MKLGENNHFLRWYFSPSFVKIRQKMWNFLLMANFWTCLNFFAQTLLIAFLRRHSLKQIIIKTFELIVSSSNLLCITLIIFYLFCLVPSDFISWLWWWRCDNRWVWELWVCQGVRMRVRHCLFRAVITYPITPHATMIWKKSNRNHIRKWEKPCMFIIIPYLYVCISKGKSKKMRQTNKKKWNNNELIQYFSVFGSLELEFSTSKGFSTFHSLLLTSFLWIPISIINKSQSKHSFSKLIKQTTER